VRLAKAYAKAGRLVEAEFFVPGTVDPAPEYGKPRKTKPKWRDLAFIKEMAARHNKNATPWDKLVLDSSLDRGRLARELAFWYMLDGNFAEAQAASRSIGDSERLRTDPFVIHVIDCHDCDHAKYENAPWTRGTLIARLVELAKAAGGTGEPAAEASLAVGNAMYNVTWWGNARVVFSGTNQETSDASAAMRWYKRAYDLSKNREFKAKAAFLAAKAELGTKIGEPYGGYSDSGPYSDTWFPVVKSLADTKYYKEILRECGHYRDWLARQH
jgi:hypothetical protein